MVGVRHSSPAGRVHRHHDFAELMFVLRGTGIHRVNDLTRPLEPGQIVLVRPDDRHVVRGGATGLDFINVAFSTDLMVGMLGAAKADVARWFRGSEPPVCTLGADDALRAERHFRRVLDRYQVRPDPFDAIGLLAAVFSSWPDSPAMSSAPAWLQSATALMHEEHNMREGMPRLRSIAGVSQAHLSREMRTHFGMPAVEWLAHVRLRHAAVLLATSVDSVSDIAERCGFDNSSYFGKRFRREYGVAPTAYRHNLSAKVLGAEGEDVDGGAGE